MSYENWLNYLQSAEKHSLLTARTRKVFYKFPDGEQMAEEYSLDTGIIQRRAWKKRRQLMGETEWEVELGEIAKQINPAEPNIGDGGGSNANVISSDFVLRECNAAPQISKRVTKKNIEFRIRNMMYPQEVYKVTAEPEKRAIVVRTTNKKYYKEIKVPELERCNLVPEQSRITVHYQFNTLIITYAKPELVGELEAQVLLMLKNVPTETDLEEQLMGLLGNK